MPLGHIAVVTKVISVREIEVDHANWVPGAIQRQIRVLDVSAGNDWTKVRVELTEQDHFGAIYGTNGFIYGWPLELGPQIIDIAATLTAFHKDRPQAASEMLPIVVGPQGVTTDSFPQKAVPVVIYGRRQAR